jgi:hypothetical protein
MNHHIPSSQALVVVKIFAYFPTDFCIIYPCTFCEYSVPGPCMGILRAKKLRNVYAGSLPDTDVQLLLRFIL